MLFAAVMAFQMKAQTVLDVVVDSPNHTILEAAVIEADLAGTLSGPGPFTVFAPTDDAFNALPEGTIDALLADPTGDLTTILLYHVLSTAVFSGDLQDGASVPTIQGENVTVTLGAQVLINNAVVTFADIAADNGVVHVIDAVLLPQAVLSNTVYDVIANHPDLNTLEAAVDAAGLATTLAEGGPYTVFAPNDDAFNLLPEGLLTALLEDPTGLLTEILFYHVVDGTVLAGSIEDNQIVTTLYGEDITFTFAGSAVFVNDAQIIITDLEADNGVVHIIDAVLNPFPPALPTIFEIVENSPDHTVLEIALLESGLNVDLTEGVDLTLFAPTDAAFDALPAGTVEGLLADPNGLLTEILLYHVTGGVFESSMLSDGQELVTLNGASVLVTIDNGVFINNALVEFADIQASNGVVHVLSAVLLPQPESNTVLDIIANSDDHNTLEAAVIDAELADVLAGPGTFTVFAPTDEAFNALPAGTVEALLAGPTSDLAQILLYHVAGSVLTSDMLSDGQEIVTLQGQDVVVSIENGQVRINDALVTVADIEADNGVVHVIDAVLLPQPALENSVWDIIVDSPTHTTLEAAIEASGLNVDLDLEGNYTVFAPTDAAFEALPEGTVEALLADPNGLLTDILLYHVLGFEELAAELVDDEVLTTLSGINVTVNIVTTGANQGVFINNAKVVVQDLIGSNGVVHVIDAVLIPPTIFDVVSNSAVHNTLQTALEAADLDGTLDSPGSFTLFAPTDAAFNALPAGLIADLLADPSGNLTQILLFHVIEGEALSSSLEDGQVIQTLYGADVTISITPDGVFVDDAQVTIADIRTSNGVVHVIDAVLVPTTVWGVIANSEVHNTLEGALAATNLDLTLNDMAGEFTVFAPTDAAFSALPAGTIEALLADLPLLTQILTYHAVGSVALSTDLEDGQVIETLQGSNVVVNITADGVFINDAEVIIADIVTDNGVVHVIDAVLSIPTNVEEAEETTVMTLFPNPVGETLNIDLSGYDRVMYEIVSMTGARVMEGIFNGGLNQLNVSGLNAGVYNVRLMNESSVKVSAFIKQ